MSKEITYIIQEIDPNFPEDGWSTFADFGSYFEAQTYLLSLRKEWPASQWRLIKEESAVLDD